VVGQFSGGGWIEHVFVDEPGRCRRNAFASDSPGSAPRLALWPRPIPRKRIFCPADEQTLECGYHAVEHLSDAQRRIRPPCPPLSNCAVKDVDAVKTRRASCLPSDNRDCVGDPATRRGGKTGRLVPRPTWAGFIQLCRTRPGRFPIAICRTAHRGVESNSFSGCGSRPRYVRFWRQDRRANHEIRRPQPRQPETHGVPTVCIPVAPKCPAMHRRSSDCRLHK